MESGVKSEFEEKLKEREEQRDKLKVQREEERNKDKIDEEDVDVIQDKLKGKPSQFLIQLKIFLTLPTLHLITTFD